MLPETFELARPLVQRADFLRVRSIEHLAAIASHMDQTNIPQHPKVLRYTRLLQPESNHNLTDRALLEREVIQYLAPSRLGDSVEGV